MDACPPAPWKSAWALVDKAAFIAVFLSHGCKLYGFGTQQQYASKNREGTNFPHCSYDVLWTERSFGVSQFYHLEVSQKVEFIKEPEHGRPEHGVPMRAPLRHGTRGQRTIMPGSVEEKIMYVPRLMLMWECQCICKEHWKVWAMMVIWPQWYTQAGTVRTNSGHTYFQLAQIGFPGPIHEALSVFFGKEAQVGNESCCKKNVST